MQLAECVALVTGAGLGIAQAAACLLARERARVAALGRTEPKLQETVARSKRDGGEAMVVIAAIARADAMQPALGRICDRWGRLDIVFANAGVNGVWAPIEELAPEEWTRILEINLTGIFLTVKYAVPYLKRQGGSIIITASVNSTRIFRNTGTTAYFCSKAAQVAFTKMIALALAPHRIRANVICPGAITTKIANNTDRHDLDKARVPVEFPEGTIPLTGGRLGTPEQMARLVLFLASDATDHIPGTEIGIDGAESLLMG